MIFDVSSNRDLSKACVIMCVQLESIGSHEQVQCWSLDIWYHINLIVWDHLPFSTQCYCVSQLGLALNQTVIFAQAYSSSQLTTEDILEDKPSLSDSTPTKKKYTNPRGSNFDDLSDKDIYEIQLRNLQSQLETAMIEKTSLGTNRNQAFQIH